MFEFAFGYDSKTGMLANQSLQCISQIILNICKKVGSFSKQFVQTAPHIVLKSQ